MRKNRVLVFIIGLLIITQALYSQSKQNNSELDMFLRSKVYSAIPLKKFITGHLYLTAHLNDTLAVFVLDTGASSTVIESKAGNKFRLESMLTDNKAVGAGGSAISLKETLVEKFEIGDYQLDSLKIHLMNLDHINNAFRRVGVQQVDGVIGADILDKGAAIIDYANLVLYLK